MSRKAYKKKKKPNILGIIVVIIIIIFIASFMMLKNKGSLITDVAVTGFTITENNMTVYPKITGSSGFIGSYKSRVEGKKLYVDFYSTSGVNNSKGAIDKANIVIKDIDQVYYMKGSNKYELLWEKK